MKKFIFHSYTALFLSGVILVSSCAVLNVEANIAEAAVEKVPIMRLLVKIGIWMRYAEMSVNCDESTVECRNAKRKVKEVEAFFQKNKDKKDIKLFLDLLHKAGDAVAQMVISASYR